MPDAAPPATEYAARRLHWQAQQALSNRRFILLGNWRLGLGIAAAVLAWLAFQHLLSGWWLLIPIVPFIALVVWHRRIVRTTTLAARAIRYYDSGIARLQNQWPGRGESGERFRNPEHIYADDLDVFGKGSLFELLSTARTAAGEDTLAEWLLKPASREAALARQEAVLEFRSRLDLREDIALLGEDLRARVQAIQLAAWGCHPPIVFAPVLKPAALILSIAAAVAFLAFLTTAIPLWPFLIIFACEALLAYSIRKQTVLIVGGVETPARDLRLLALLIARLEPEQWTSPLLKSLQTQLQVSGLSASQRIAQLERLIDFLGGDHPILKLVRHALLMPQQAAMRIELWRRETGPRLSGWIRSLSEFEAISAISTLAFEHPDWIFPELLANQPAQFEAQSLRHPLLPSGVPNDVLLHPNLRLLIVSGSNMSGKSTLLRAIGLNAVLAWAGAPVPAAHLRLSPLHTGASIRITDSLLDNRSRFFAEITRLRQIVDLTKRGLPVLFLLDELLSGTNSHDRRIGAAGIVRGLLRADSIGLITTHDLALAEIANDVGSLAANVHFEDRIADGQMEFDYRLRKGVVTRSNALELMRAIGLDV